MKHGAKNRSNTRKILNNNNVHTHAHMHPPPHTHTHPRHHPCTHTHTHTHTHLLLLDMSGGLTLFLCDIAADVQLYSLCFLSPEVVGFIHCQFSWLRMHIRTNKRLCVYMFWLLLFFLFPPPFMIFLPHILFVLFSFFFFSLSSNMYTYQHCFDSVCKVRGLHCLYLGSCWVKR